MTLDEEIKKAQDELNKKEKADERRRKEERRVKYKPIVDLIRSGKPEDLDIALEDIEASIKATRDGLKFSKISGDGSTLAVEYLEVGKAMVIAANREKARETGKGSIGSSPISLKSDA